MKIHKSPAWQFAKSQISCIKHLAKSIYPASTKKGTMYLRSFEPFAVDTGKRQRFTNVFQGIKMGQKMQNEAIGYSSLSYRSKQALNRLRPVVYFQSRASMFVVMAPLKSLLGTEQILYGVVVRCLTSLSCRGFDFRGLPSKEKYISCIKVQAKRTQLASVRLSNKLFYFFADWDSHSFIKNEFFLIDLLAFLFFMIC